MAVPPILFNRLQLEVASEKYGQWNRLLNMRVIQEAENLGATGIASSTARTPQRQLMNVPVVECGWTR